MATRFYLPISGTPPLAALAVNANWELTNSLVRLPCYITKQNTALTTYTLTWPATTTQQWCWRQWQSLPLKAGYSWTTADTVSTVIGKCAETTTGGDTHLVYIIRIVSGDGSVIRGVIGLMHAISSEYPLVASAATRIHNVLTTGATNFSSQAGDRIIIEIGLHGVTPVAENIQMRFGDPSATADFALTAGLTTDLCPWVQLSRTVEFGTLLAIQDAVQAQAAENPALVQHSSLTIANVAQAQSADNIALVAHSFLAVGDATQAQTADNLTLVYQEGVSSTPLVIQDAAQAQAEDNLGLTAHIFLVISDSAQAQAVDGTALVAHSFLAIGNATQIQATDNLGLVTHNFLNIGNSTQSQSVDNAVFITRSLLSIGDSSQAQIANNAALVVHNFLAISNASQVQAVGNLTLATHSILAIANAAQAQNMNWLVLIQHSVLNITNAVQEQIANSMTLAAYAQGGDVSENIIASDMIIITSLFAIKIDSLHLRNIKVDSKMEHVPVTNLHLQNTKTNSRIKQVLIDGMIYSPKRHKEKR